MKHVNLMAKPTGSVCNLDCEYCFYLEKWKLYPETKNYKMDYDVLEKYIQQVVECQPNNTEQYTFAWQGGEPTLMGINFFRKAIQLQKIYTKGKPFINTIQTNGTTLNNEWCQFLADNKFLVGISMDGTEQQHDTYRKAKNGQGTYKQVARGLELLKKYNVDFNVLVVVHKDNVDSPLTLYKHLRNLGVEYIQFTPLVERMDEDAKGMELKLLHPKHKAGTVVTPWTLEPMQYANFLTVVFKEWAKNDIGNVFINMFETTLRLAVGERSNSCVFDVTCGDALIVEHNGDIYSCDHFVFPEHKIGNLMANSLESMVEGLAQLKFGQDKKDNLPQECLNCRYLTLCNGGCPKHRFEPSMDGSNNKNYLCNDYKTYFQFILPHLKEIYDALVNDVPANQLKTMFRKKFS